MTEMKRGEGTQCRGRRGDGDRDEGLGTEREEKTDGRLQCCCKRKTPSYYKVSPNLTPIIVDVSSRCCKRHLCAHHIIPLETSILLG